MATYDDEVRGWQRRLNELNLQKAKYGLGVDPSISIEIEDIMAKLAHTEDVRSQLNLLNIYRHNVQTYVDQAAHFNDLTVPIHIVNGLRAGRENIARIKAILAQKYGVMVEDAPQDLAPVPSPTSAFREPVRSGGGSADLLEALTEGLETLEEMLKAQEYAQALRYIRTLKALTAQGRTSGR